MCAETKHFNCTLKRQGSKSQFEIKFHSTHSGPQACDRLLGFPIPGFPSPTQPSEPSRHRCAQRAGGGGVTVVGNLNLPFRAGHGTPDPHPHRHPRLAGDRGCRSHPRFAGDRGSTGIPTAIPDLPESGIQLSTIEYCKGAEFRLPQCLTLRLIVLPKLINLRRPAMSDGQRR
jgi:hypothetical protein